MDEEGKDGHLIVSYLPNSYEKFNYILSEEKTLFFIYSF